jgi:subtilisin family serine protease
MRVRGIPNESTEGEKHQVYIAGGGYVVITDTFSFEFADNVNDAAIQGLLSEKLSFKFIAKKDRVEIDGHLINARSNRYKVSIDNKNVDKKTTPIEALREVNALYRQPGIKFVYPDLIHIIFSRWDLINDIRLTSSAVPLIFQDCTSTTPNDKYFPSQWPLVNTGSNSGTSSNPGTPDADIDADEAWLITTGSPDTIIAVLDLGVDPNHPDLPSTKLLPAIDATGDGLPGPKFVDDRHGTWVAGVAAAKTNNCKGIAGVDWEAKILPVRIAEAGVDTAGEPNPWIFEPDVRGNGFAAAVAAGAKVLVNSWNDKGTAPDQHLNNNIRAAIAGGAVVIFSAGNYYKHRDCVDWVYDPTQKDCESGVLYPATLAQSNDPVLRNGLIVVSATNEKDEFKTVSNFVGHEPDAGTENFWGSRHGCSVSLSAPGASQYTTNYTKHPDDVDGYYPFFRGTSAAAPLVAGAAALLLSVHPGATPDQIKRWLQSGADPGFGQAQDANQNPIWDEFYGAGRLNIKGALDVAESEMSVPAPPAGLNIQ